MPTIGASRSAPSSATCSRPGFGNGISDSRHQPREVLKRALYLNRRSRTCEWPGPSDLQNCVQHFEQHGY